ncbi:MAG: aminoglycoside phosphotransferase family protein [Candidatus Methylumidiphilus sp.]
MLNIPDARLTALADWLTLDLNLPLDSLRPASSDASFRRYFRATVGEDSFIIMDAPPAHEDVRPFIKIAGLLREAGVQAPKIHAQDAEQGFLLLCDFGNRPYLDSLNAATADALYGDALDSLARIKRGVDIRGSGLPQYDEALLRREMDLCPEWYLSGLLQREPAAAEQAVLAKTWRVLIDSALEQPQVCVHRDYHSRNLMITDADNPGVLDFQDAVVGPATYDLVSLLRDCYIAWPQARVEGWVRGYHRRLLDDGLVAETDLERFLRWFDLMGLQRHIKVLGIFSRLHLRDGKPGYLGDIPRTLNYVVEACGRHSEMADFLALLQDGIIEQTYATLGQPS